MNQPELKGLEQGERLRDEGIALVTAQNVLWNSRFMVVAKRLLDEFGEITADQVVEEIGPPPGHRNAIGAAMRELAQRNRLVVSTYRKSTNPSRHAAIIAVWRRRRHS